ncbi:helix-turn-helix domain-containing protein [Catellatospora vulcania]|uniref:helix-turn-helix domain-containing protein n=1 Tax=Catellatospora vulcania TaxID=1460450 RepID=UPI0012D376A6|nr:helix-turn-helix domain-containing protein [Catellatospora vulcania]
MPEEMDLLTDAQEQAYRSLVESGGGRVADVAELGELSHAQAAAALGALLDAGLAVVEPGPDPVYQPLPPDVALGASLLRRQEALERGRRLMAELHDQYRASSRRRGGEQVAELVVGAEPLRRRLRQVQDLAGGELLWFCRANPVALASGENTAEFDALARGVGCRVVYERESLLVPGVLDNVAEGIRRGQVARATQALPVRMLVADRSTAVLSLIREPGDAAGPRAAVINNGEMLHALVALFDSHWQAAVPIRVPGGGADHAGGPDEAELYVLSLVVGGVPDKAIASQLGVSRRTVQRRLDRLMALAGVDTRAGLAYHAARCGWL